MDPRDVAYAELQAKTLQQIQSETALVWAYRACAAYRLAAEAKASGQAAKSAKWLLDACEYEHEAVEHGALAGDKVLAVVRKVVAGQ